MHVISNSVIVTTIICVLAAIDWIEVYCTLVLTSRARRMGSSDRWIENVFASPLLIKILLRCKLDRHGLLDIPEITIISAPYQVLLHHAFSSLAIPSRS